MKSSGLIQTTLRSDFFRVHSHRAVHRREKMMIKTFEVENYRSCLKTKIDLHPTLSVLIGPNGSGKTNILQAILFLSKMANHDQLFAPQHDRSTVSSRIRVVFQEKQRTSLRLSASISAYTDESNNDVLTNSRQKWRLQDAGGRKASFEAPINFAAGFAGEARAQQLHFWRVARQYPLTRIPEIPEWTLPAIREILRYCKGIRYYSASQFTNPGACPDRKSVV